MLPASDLSEILTNLSALNLQPTTAAQVLAAVLAPLLRSADPDPPEDLPRRRAGQPRSQPRRALRRKRKRISRPRVAAAAAAASEPADGPRQRAARALAANLNASLTRVAKIAGVSRGTVVNARDELAAEGRKSRPAEPSERRERAQRFLKDALAHGPKRVTDAEEAAAKAHVDLQALEQARAELGIVCRRRAGRDVELARLSARLPQQR